MITIYVVFLRYLLLDQVFFYTEILNQEGIIYPKLNLVEPKVNFIYV
jgi:hypothetical protein